MLNNTFAIVFIRQLRNVVFAQSPLAATIVTAHATLNDSQFAQTCEYRRPLAFICQQLPRRGGELQLIKQLFLRQTVGNDREHIAVNKRRVARQFTRERRFRPTFDFGSDHALLKRHRFRIGFQTDWPDGDTQRFTGLAQHPA